MVTRIGIGLAVALTMLAATGCSTLPRSYVVVMPNPDGTVGTVMVRGNRGERTVNEASKATGFDAGRKQVELPAEQVHRTFWQVLTGAPPDPVRFVLYFDEGEIVPNRLSTAVWDKLLITVRNWPAPEIEIDGHADRRASDDYNLELADQRAEWIFSGVVHAGADPALVHVRSYGEQRPAVPTEDGVMEPLNRRVEVAIR